MVLIVYIAGIIFWGYVALLLLMGATYYWPYVLAFAVISLGAMLWHEYRP